MSMPMILRPATAGLVLVLAAAHGAPVAAQTTELVSKDSFGVQGNSNSFLTQVDRAISADGRFVVFDSFATNLVAGDTNGTFDIFVHDRVSGETTRISVASDDTQGNRDSFRPSISADGRFVAFESLASTLVVADTNGRRDIFVHDRLTEETSLVSVASDGTQGNTNSLDPSISADGTAVVFESLATNLVPGGANGFQHIFVRDRDVNENTAPVAVAGADQEVLATSGAGAMVTLDGSGSTDAEDAAADLSYEWTGPFGTVAGQVVTVQVPPGSHEITLTVTDAGGLQASDTVQVSVFYGFELGGGFHEPIEDAPTVNTGKAGRTYPVKWQLPDGNGGFVRDLGVVMLIASVAATCDEGAAVGDEVAAEETGDTGLRYDLEDEQYVYNWETAKSWRNDCRNLVLRFNDGTTHEALFAFR